MSNAASNAKQVAAPVSAEAETVAEQGLLDRIIEEGRFTRDAAARDRGRDLVKEFVTQVLEGEMTVSRDTEATINARIAQIDHLMSIQLNEILHHPQLQKLEATWRGVKYLVDHSECTDMLKIKVLNVSKKDLLRDLQRASEFDQSALFMKVYEDEFATPGGIPFSALIGDYEFSKHPEDMELLEKISNVAAAAHAPFPTAAAPDLLSLESFTELGGVPDLSRKL